MSFRSGAANGPAAIREFSWSLESYSPILEHDLLELTVLDLGDLSLASGSIEDALSVIETAMQRAASAARLPVMLGGEHTVSLGGYRGIRHIHPDALLIYVDAHADFRDEYEGQAVTHASWVYHAGAEAGYENIIQLGVRSGAREEWPRSRGLTRFSQEPLDIPAWACGDLAQRPIYLSIDIDVLDPAFAPGTGSPEPGGVSFRELAAFLYSLAALRVVALDVVEVAPNLDPSGITAVAAAKLVREAILLFSRSG